MTEFIGERVGGCQLINSIGHGAMGTVYRAHHHKLNIDVAVKIINNQLIQRDTTFVSRFLREAQQAAKLNHPNIVRIYDVGFDTGLYYIIMEYIDGYNLKEIVRKIKKLLPEIAVPIIIQALSGLSEAHMQGVLHRDLKPDNMMLNSRGIVKITDFGLAKPMNQNEGIELTGARATMGTPAYMSIEQWQQGDIDSVELDERADIYSIGVTLFHLLTGTYIYRADSHAGIIRKMYANERMDFLKTFATVWEPDRMLKIRKSSNGQEQNLIWNEIFSLYKNLDTLNSIIMKLTAFNRDDRYRSSEDALIDLKNYVASLDQKQIELFSSSFREQLFSDYEKPIDVNDCEIVDSQDSDSETTSFQDEKITFVKTECEDFYKEESLRAVPPKINTKAKPVVMKIQGRFSRNRKLDQQEDYVKPKANQNTLILISSIAAAIALVIILILLSGGNSKIEDKYEELTKTEPVKETYTPAKEIIHKAPKFDTPEESEEVKHEVDPSKKETRENNTSQNERAFEQSKKILRDLDDRLADLKKLYEEPEPNIEIQKTLQQEWISLIDCIYKFESDISNYEQMILTNVEIAPEVRFCELIDEMLNTINLREKRIINFISQSDLIDENNSEIEEQRDLLDTTLDKIVKIKVPIMKSEKLINKYIKIRNSVIAWTVTKNELEKAQKEVNSNIRSIKLEIFRMDKEINRLQNSINANNSEIEKFTKRINVLWKSINVVGREDRPFVKSEIESCSRRIQKLENENKESRSKIQDYQDEIEEKNVQKDKYEDDLSDYEEDLENLESSKLDEMQKEKAKMLNDVAKLKESLEKQLKDIISILSPFHKIRCDYIKQTRQQILEKVSDLYSET